MTSLVTAIEAAKVLRTTRQRIYRLVSSGQLKGFKNDSGKYLIFSESIEKYIEICYNTYAHKCVTSGGK